MMTIKLVAYGIAKDILQHKVRGMDVGNGATIHDLKSTLVELYPEFGRLASLRFAVNADYCEDSYLLKEDDEVVIIPPVSGG